MNKNIVIITAAGKGNRMNTALPKQFLNIGDKPILAHTIDFFEKNQIINDIYLVLSKDQIDYALENIVKKYSFNKVRKIICGGKERGDSIYNALNEIRAGNDDYIWVHDGVRPFLNDSLIQNCFEQVQKTKSAVCCVKVKDTIKYGKDGYLEKTLERDFLYSIQTPQVFRYQDLKYSYDEAQKENFHATDDAALIEKYLKIKPAVVAGDYLNIKITTPEDLILAEYILNQN